MASPPSLYASEFRFQPVSRAAAVVLLASWLAACGDRANETAAAPSTGAAAAASPASPAVPAVAATPVSPAHPTAAPAVAAVQAAPVKLPLAVQGVAPAGLTVRIKGAEVGGDATVLDVSISFANRITNSTMLALADTYLQDESGAKLHIQRPEGNRDITIREGQTLEGQLVFMGSVATSARQLKLVFNDGNQGDNIVAPGLAIDVPLPAAKG
ncbi:hypothetical protein [Acidovorax sp. Leaf78]|uniref:hypothetical protein n=1 Tax=unclassified Acidovorax TaxID=2684926 RepID=UPI000AD456C2|nr:hypothetical protein [Acidovorax sp. Leaf78]